MGIPNSLISEIHVTPLVLTVSAISFSFSINATVQPFFAAICAADDPAGPPPTTTTSKFNSSN